MNINFLDYKNKIIQKEIAILLKELNIYKLDLESLIASTPKLKENRIMLIKLAIKCTTEAFILQYIISKKKLPIKKVVLFSLINKNIIIKYEKYILALILIFSNPNLPHIQNYLTNEVGDSID